MSNQLCLQRVGKNQMQHNINHEQEDSHQISSLIPKRLLQCWLTELERKCSFWLSHAQGNKLKTYLQQLHFPAHEAILNQ